jgi:hypothetical protein
MSKQWHLQGLFSDDSDAKVTRFQLRPKSDDHQHAATAVRQSSH